jgi:4-hydroxy-3-methylbut-2-enyl diphosphate reductase
LNKKKNVWSVTLCYKVTALNSETRSFNPEPIVAIKRYPMKIIRAEHLGMCFGVRDAIALAVEHSDREPLTILGELVHNDAVLQELRARGIRIASDASDVNTAAVMVTAHGASDKAINRARDLGLKVSEATCPLVHSAHRALARLVKEGCHPVVIGKRDHVEVRGMTEDLHDFDVVLSEADVLELKEHPRIGVVAQTTQPIETVRRLVECIRRQFPSSTVSFIDTVCQPTKQRQTAAIDLAQRADVVIVVGGSQSNNTRQLARTCAQYCSRVHHVQSSAELHSDWFQPDDMVGLTAGTSTPDPVIDGVEHCIREFFSTLVGAAAMPAKT